MIVIKDNKKDKMQFFPPGFRQGGDIVPKNLM
jgi:hypothetical protein